MKKRKITADKPDNIRLFTRRRFLIGAGALFALGAAGGLAAACKTKSSSTNTTATTSTSLVRRFRIGLMLDLTGYLSAYGLAMRDNVQLMKNRLNNEGGLTIKGQKYSIETIIENDQSTLEGASAAANRLVFDDRVKYVIGGIAPFINRPAGPIFEQAKVLHIMLNWGGAPGEMDARTPYTFAGGFNAPAGGLMLLEGAAKYFPEARKAVLVIPDDGTTVYNLPLWQSSLSRLGFTVLNDGQPVLYANDTMDYKPVTEKLSALKPEIIIHMQGTAEASAAIIKNLRTSGNKSPYAAPAGVYDLTAYMNVVGNSNCNNILIVGCGQADDPNNPPLYQEMMQAMAGKLPVIHPAQDLDVFIQAVKKADSLDVDEIKAAWESMDSVETISGKAVFSGDNTTGLKHHVLSVPYPVQLINNGQIELKPWLPAVEVP
jgi:branched-chain amino acid transport system substrate-binding protein